MRKVFPERFPLVWMSTACSHLPLCQSVYQSVYQSVHLSRPETNRDFSFPFFFLPHSMELRVLREPSFTPTQPLTSLSRSQAAPTEFHVCSQVVLMPSVGNCSVMAVVRMTEKSFCSTQLRMLGWCTVSGPYRKKVVDCRGRPWSSRHH